MTFKQSRLGPTKAKVAMNQMRNYATNMYHLSLPAIFLHAHTFQVRLFTLTSRRTKFFLIPLWSFLQNLTDRQHYYMLQLNIRCS